MLHEMFTEPERSESVLEDDLIDQRLRAIFTEPEDRALRARREYWKVAGSLLASKENLAKAAIAMMRILGLYEHRAKPKDRVSRALQEFWKVAGSLLASDKDLAKAALAMIKILEDPSF